MSKFHVNDKGVVSRCSAKEKCPFGGESGKDNHFDSIKEARKAYESHMNDKTIPQLKSSSREDTERLMFLAKSDSPEVIRYAVYSGGEQVLAQASANKYSNAETLREIEKRTKNKDTLRRVQNHPNYVPQELSPELVERYARNREENHKLVDFIHGDASARTVKKILDNSDANSIISKEVLMSSSRGASIENKARALKFSRNMILDKETVEAHGFKINELYPHLSNSQKLDVAKKSLSPDKLDDLSTNLIKDGIKDDFKSTSNLDVALAVYDNDNTRESTKRKLEKESPVFKSWRKVRKLDSELKQYDSSLVRESNLQNEHSAGEPVSLKIDRELVKQHRLSKVDLDMYVTKVKGYSIENGKYNARTGEYTGYYAS